MGEAAAYRARRAEVVLLPQHILESARVGGHPRTYGVVGSGMKVLGRGNRCGPLADE